MYKNNKKEYTPLRRFYAWTGFLFICFLLVIFLWAFIAPDNFINAVVGLFIN
jgi:hypothetical protein